MARSFLPLGRQRDADDVLDRVAGDAHDHDAGERLRDAERLHGRVERVDEPVETNAAATPRPARTTSAQAKGIGPCGRPRAPARPRVRAQVRPEPGAVDDQQADRADHRDRDLVLARVVAERGPTGRAARSRRGRAAGASRCRSAAACRKRITSPSAARAPATIASPRTSRAFANSEPRIEVWRRRSPCREREQHDEELGQVPERRLEHAGHRRAEAGARPPPWRRRSARRARRGRAPETTKTAVGERVGVVQRRRRSRRPRATAGDDDRACASRLAAGRTPCARTSPPVSAPTPPAPCRRPIASSRVQLRLVRAQLAGSAPGSARAARPPPRRPPP